MGTSCGVVRGRAHGVRPRPQLAVHALGPWQVAVDGVVVGPWPGHLRRSLLAFLVTHRQPWPTPETLIEALWPEAAAPVAARNCLNVAMHGLRSAMRGACSEPIVVFGAGHYRFAPRLEVWFDVEDFEHRLRRCRDLERARPIAAATAAYEDALRCYRGEFLVEAPYEQWAAAARERLRLAHLDALGRLSALYFEQRRHCESAELCAAILERDPCREDVHRRLMRCHARQGQTHLALLAYRRCAQVLTDELGIRPGHATTALYVQLRNHQPV